MKREMLCILLGLALLVSCKKDEDETPVNQDDVRVYTKTMYYNNGNLMQLERFSYDPEGIIKRRTILHVYDSTSTDTTNLRKTYIEYEYPNDSVIYVISYISGPDYLSSKDTTLYRIDITGHIREYLKTTPSRFYENEIRYIYSKYAYDNEGYMTSSYTIIYERDSVTGFIEDRYSTVRVIENGNCVSTGSTELSYYTEKVNTLNYGMDYYGKINKNPVSLEEHSGYNIDYTYEYHDGMISKSVSDVNSRNSTVGDATYFYSYIKL